MSKNTLPKLFIPGPVDIAPETFEAMCQPMIGHRGGDFEALYSSIQPNLKPIFGTERPVYLSTSSAWGVMEGCIRNLVQTKVLNLCCGAFSDKWFSVAQSCGKNAEKIQVEWGQPISPDDVRTKLSEGGFDTVTLVHNETSTGVMNDLAGIAAVVREFPDVLLVVDTVSSLSAVPIEMDKLGIDVVLAGVQKALALPPGLAVFAISEAALERASTTEGRGYYFDFAEFEKNGNAEIDAATTRDEFFTAAQWNAMDEAAQQEVLMNYRLTYLSDTMVNWCPALGTVLANDEVKEGLSERGGQLGNRLRFLCFIVKPRFKKLNKGPLCPLKIVRIVGANLTVPVEREADIIQLMPVSFNINFGGNGRMRAGLDGILLCR